MSSNIFSLFYSEVKIYLLCDNEEMTAMLKGLWPESCVKWTRFTDQSQLLERFFSDPPNILIISYRCKNIRCEDVIQAIKKESVYGHVRLVALLPREQLLEGFDWSKFEVHDYLLDPCYPSEARARLELLLYRSTHSLDANPLTRLPGNVSITEAVARYIHEKISFSLAYVDVDNFKPFNDRYGFARGDEVLLMSARILTSIIKNLNVYPNFVGHIGGDDFVFILPPDQMVSACENVIAAYDAIVPGFYDEEDRRLGHIASVDRKGNPQTFPFLSLSIAVVTSTAENPRQFSELSHIAGELKHVVKKQVGSTYILDRRQNQ